MISLWSLSMLFSLDWVEVLGDKSSTDAELLPEVSTTVSFFLESPAAEFRTTFPVVQRLTVALDKDTSCTRDLAAFSAGHSVCDSALHVITGRVCDAVCSNILDRATEQISMWSGCEVG